MAQKKNSRRGRGEGSVFYSKAKGCWVWRAVTGFKPGGGVRHTEGRGRSQADAVKAKKAAEKTNRLPSGDSTTVGEYLDYWLTDVASQTPAPRRGRVTNGASVSTSNRMLGVTQSSGWTHGRSTACGPIWQRLRCQPGTSGSVARCSRRAWNTPSVKG